MSNQSESAGEPVGDIDNAASIQLINWLGVACLVVAVLLIYALIASWPVIQEVTVNGKVVRSYKAFHLFGFTAESWDDDKRMLFTVVLAGAIGSLVHALTSFADFVGNRRFSVNWIWWYLLRLPVGSAIAIFFYLIIRGGLIVPTLQSGSSAFDTQATLALNPYSMAAFAALAGMFAKNASDKLAEVFDAMMSRKDPVKRSDPLQDGAGGLKTDPEKLTRGTDQTLTIIGKGFKKETEVKVGGVKRDAVSVTDTQIKIAITAKDVEKIGKLEVSIKNPNESELKKSIEIVEAGRQDAPVKPEIKDTAPELKAGMTPVPTLVVTGTGFANGCEVFVNDEKRIPQSSSATEVKLQLTAKDVEKAVPIKLTVKNPGAGGLTSDVRTIEVKAT